MPATRSAEERVRPLAATQKQGDWPRPQGGHTGPRGRETFPLRPPGAQGIGHAPMASTWAQGTGLVPTTRTRGPGDQPRPHGGLTKPRGLGTPLRRPHGAQGTGHAPTAATQAQGIGYAPTVATRGPGDHPRFHGGHTGPRGPATPPRQPQCPR